MNLYLEIKHRLRTDNFQIPPYRQAVYVSGNGIATPYKLTMTRYLLTVSTIILFVLTILFAWTFVIRWTIPFNSEGNYFNEKTSIVYHEQSVFIYGLITFFLLLFVALTAFFARQKFKEK